MINHYKLIYTTNAIVQELVGNTCRIEISANGIVYAHYKKMHLCIESAKIVRTDSYIKIETDEHDYVFESLGNAGNLYMVCYEPNNGDIIICAMGYCPNDVRIFTTLKAACDFCIRIADDSRFACVVNTQVFQETLCPNWDEIIIEG